MTKTFSVFSKVTVVMLLMLISLFISAISAKAQVVNGSFEAPIVNAPALWDIYVTASVPGWTIEWMPGSGSGDPKLELHRGVNGWLPQEGQQYAELDTDWDGPGGGINGEAASVRISQSVPTKAECTYAFSYYFSPRPGTVAVDNHMKAFWNGSEVGDHTAAGAGQTNWTQYSHVVVATGASTLITFEDHGTANSLGTFLDNVVVTETSCPPPPPPPCACTNPITETFVSDTSNTVVGGGNAVALTFIHPAWTASIPGATWIWEEDPVNPILETKSFEKSFTVSGTVLSAQLDIASDNSYKVFIDNVEVAADPAENNFQLATQDIHNLTSVLTPGTHTLRIEVRNHPGSNDPQSNPAGLLYKFEVRTCPPKCCGGEVTVTNNNVAVVRNSVNTNAFSGGNNANGGNGSAAGNGGDVTNSDNNNIGGKGGRGGNGEAGGVIITGNANAYSGVSNKVNTNIVRIRR